MLADRAVEERAARQRPKLRSEPNRTDLFHDRETFVHIHTRSLSLSLPLLSLSFPREQAGARSSTRDEYRRGWSRSSREEAVRVARSKER